MVHGIFREGYSACGSLNLLSQSESDIVVPKPGVERRTPDSLHLRRFHAPIHTIIFYAPQTQRQSRLETAADDSLINASLSALQEEPAAQMPTARGAGTVTKINEDSMELTFQVSAFTIDIIHESLNLQYKTNPVNSFIEF